MPQEEPRGQAQAHAQYQALVSKFNINKLICVIKAVVFIDMSPDSKYKYLAGKIQNIAHRQREQAEQQNFELEELYKELSMLRKSDASILSILYGYVLTLIRFNKRLKNTAVLKLSHF